MSQHISGFLESARVSYSFTWLSQRMGLELSKPSINLSDAPCLPSTSEVMSLMIFWSESWWLEGRGVEGDELPKGVSAHSFHVRLRNDARFFCVNSFKSLRRIDRSPPTRVETNGIMGLWMRSGLEWSEGARRNLLLPGWERINHAGEKVLPVCPRMEREVGFSKWLD